MKDNVQGGDCGRLSTSLTRAAGRLTGPIGFRSIGLRCRKSRGRAAAAPFGATIGRLVAVVGLALGLALGLGGGLAACTTLKLGYENLPWLLGWQADRFLALDGEQEAIVDRHLEKLQAWHRKEQLPVYAALVGRIEQEIRSPIAADRPADWRRALLATWPPVAERLAPLVAEVGLTLRPEQLAHLRKAFARANEKFAAEHRPADPQARLAARTKLLTERAETFLGRLDDGQRERVRQAASAMAESDDGWWAQRQARQQRIVAFLTRLVDERPALAQATALARDELLALFDPRSVVVSPESDRLTADLLAAATPDQVRRALARVGQYRGDFVTLSRR